MALIYHPVLRVTRDVHERTVRIWERSGWTRVVPTPLAEQPLDETPAPDEGDDPLTEED